MLYINKQITAVGTNSVSVYNDDVSATISVWLPSVISRRPVVGDRIVYIKDDIDHTNGLFISFYNESPDVFSTHVHQMLAQSTINTMALSSSQKAALAAKTTGNVT